jgi:hypothetical protein
VGQAVEAAGPGRLRDDDVEIVAGRDPVARDAVVERDQRAAVGVGGQHLGEGQRQVGNAAGREGGDLLALVFAAGDDGLAHLDVRAQLAVAARQRGHRAGTAVVAIPGVQQLDRGARAGLTARRGGGQRGHGRGGQRGRGGEAAGQPQGGPA